ncbi:unnamed protein product [Brachionus calyciflorus]|uniref:Uncharacterized protein n=1 Tax=Brachionus calyciflorus TaxID=104777 RepID=A0A814E2L6_9BILA|nr:unnamed protein product [Brachionus calyciflorus]
MMRKKSLGLLTLILLVNFSFTERQSVLLISFDGLQSEKFEQFLSLNPNSNFSRIVNNGLKSEYMSPSNPTFTYSNHITLVTGLYPESHGLTNNVVFDPQLNEKVAFSATDDVKQWKIPEPIWYTAKKQGLKTGSSFWIGDYIWPLQPNIFLRYNSRYDVFKRIDLLIDWYKKYNLDFACIYFDEPDATGHIYGPDSNEYMTKINYMDSVFGYLLKELEKKDILKRLNLIVVSDHGMSQLTNSQFIDINKYVNSNLIDFNKSFFHVVSSIYPKSDDKLHELFEHMLNIPNVKVFLKSKIPKELNYKNNDRIGPIVVFSNEGFRLIEQNLSFVDYGGHGYLANLTSMRAIFIAQGPSFKKGKMNSFENVNVYALMCQLLDIICHSNNGTIQIFEPFLN